ncbi:peroxisomal membrane protein PEX14 isoform X2 [Amborella trichopoda]|uniref:peroxisomal membrane protein PEX14 isoform X2 n=1 Tax=Amborella trichopoda TaxID=13333 RepID=UPI0005D2DC9F|nr:peroxisomal membrane protein PEX14 isoform X2 [Amborella trichopoda]|eukprot:XP_011623643.1 peroxisomal membrane protein PEX14 isoform X2 [Amborella trichopoda]
MATDSSAPGLGNEKAGTPGVEPSKPTGDYENGANVGATNENGGKSVFVNSEPMREDQVQNAIKFLSHPKVQGSPVVFRRSFLERKGLTKEEIDEAFRRVPDPPSNASTTQVATSTQGQLQSALTVQPQPPVHTLQPAAVTTMTVPTPQKSGFQWSHIALAVGLFAASGACTGLLFKNAVVPRLKSWIRKVVSEEDELEKKDQLKPRPIDEAAAAAKAAAAAAAEVARASQEMLHAKNEEGKYFEAFTKLLEVQVEEMKTMRNTICNLEGIRENPRVLDQQISKQFHSESGRPLSAPASIQPAGGAPHSQQFMDVMAMVQRGEKPPGIREINDKVPNATQPLTNSRLVPKSKPWEDTSRVQPSSIYISQTETKVVDSPASGQGAYYANGSATQTQYRQPLRNGTPMAEQQWWKQKPEPNPSYSFNPDRGANVTITEAEPENDGLQTQHSWAPSKESLPRRAWVPPPPPPVAMPEAADAIRRPRSSGWVEGAGDERSTSSLGIGVEQDGPSETGVLGSVKYDNSEVYGGTSAVDEDGSGKGLDTIVPLETEAQ